MPSTTLTANSYDVVPYISVPIPPSHPDRIAVVARLFGMTPADPQTARVLELGCASGGNLLPMAETMPGGTFVGIDLSQRQIQAGQQLIAAAGLKNATLEQKSILELGAETGTFDYIIAHGLYSWVSDDVQQKILELCRDLLSPGGVAYISYNTYPGWHLQGMLRDMLLYRTRNTADPHLRIRQSRQLLDKLNDAFAKANNVYATMLHAHVEVLRKQHDPFLFHDHLETHNKPLYFHEFNSRAESVGLQFLGEANFGDMYTGGLSPQAQQTLNSLANGVIELEQYIDFFCNRTLRRTLLCKQGIALDRKLTSDRARGIFYAANIRPQSQQPDVASTTSESFASTAGHAVNTSEPMMKAALLQLGKIWPKSIVFEELLGTCGRQLAELGRPAETSGHDATILGDGLLHGAAGGMIDLRANWPTLTTEVSATLTVSPLARAQMASSSIIANRRHESVNLNEFERFVLVRTDGTQSIDDLVRYIVAGVKDGTLRMSIEGKAANPTADLETTVRPAVMSALTGAARSALLVS
jgi:methyltransferase-like protein/SAM-dependent methyltransferase